MSYAVKPTWLIERGVYRDHAKSFRAEVERQGMQCAEVDYRPGKKPPDDIIGSLVLSDRSCVVLWGTLPLMQQIQIHHAWIPGGWCNLENLDCAKYYSHFGPWLLNSDHAILPGGDATSLQQQLYDRFGRDGEIFVRPSCVHKLFMGTVAYEDDFRDAIAPARYDSNTLIVVSSPKEIGREWRLVIVDDAVVAGSQYRDNGALSVVAGCPAEVTQYAAGVLQQVQWRPDRVFMLDVCESGGSLFVLELNSFSCSGIYACDLPAVIRTTSAVAEDQWNAAAHAQSPS